MVLASNIISINKHHEHPFFYLPKTVKLNVKLKYKNSRIPTYSTQFEFERKKNLRTWKMINPNLLKQKKEKKKKKQTRKKKSFKWTNRFRLCFHVCTIISFSVVPAVARQPVYYARSRYRWNNERYFQRARTDYDLRESFRNKYRYADTPRRYQPRWHWNCLGKRVFAGYAIFRER